MIHQWHIPKFLGNACFDLSLFLPRSLLKIHNKAGYYSSLKGCEAKKSNRSKAGISKELGYRVILILIATAPLAYSEDSLPCENWPGLLKWSCQLNHKIWHQGDTELYLTGFAWHNRYRYTRDRVNEYNENAWGGGLGKGYYDESGHLHSLFAFAFLDSHRRWQPIAGYSCLKVFALNDSIKTGIGLTAFLTQRSDINKGIPFPGILPWASLIIKQVTLSATYIPGRKDIGNVLFIVGKYTF